MRRETIVESTTAQLEMTQSEASELARVGRQLANRSEWWGSSLSEDDEENLPERTAIRVSPTGGGKWNIRVADAVGHIAIGDLQIAVRPKIPVEHLLYLFEHARRLPRTSQERAAVAPEAGFWELVAEWYLREAELLLRRDLIRDYHHVHQVLPLIRGRLEPLGTARAYYSGRLEFPCEFEEFGIDTPLNRVLRAAAGAVAGSPLIARASRRRAMAILARTEGVGTLRHGDADHPFDRRTGHYRNAITLARNILDGMARFLTHGESVAWTFLIRTPEMVEEGIRTMLALGLTGQATVEKRGIGVPGSTMTLNPDLLFNGGRAIGDVKYKISHGEWKRSDLYQLIAFAEGFQAPAGVLVDFCASDDRLSELRIGTKRIHHIPWLTDRSPDEARLALIEGFRQWLRRYTDLQAA